MQHLPRRAAALVAFVLCVLLGLPARAETAEEPMCTADCWTLSGMTIRGSATTGLTFELHGTVRSKQPQRIPLFGTT